MYSSRVTVKGQVVIPVQLRKKYGITNGTRINFVDEEGEIHLVPITPEMIKKNVGFLGTKGKLMRILMEEKKRERDL